MKKIFIVALTIIAISAKAQISTCSKHDGYWGEWKSHTTRSWDGRNILNKEYGIWGNYSGFIIYKLGHHPSEYIFKFQANNYVIPDKKTIRNHMKNNIWYEYTGTVEYYVTEEYPTIAAILKAFDFPEFNCNSGGYSNPCVKRTASARIKIMPYKKRPRCYNIYFDGVGIAIDMEDSFFNQ